MIPDLGQKDSETASSKMKSAFEVKLESKNANTWSGQRITDFGCVDSEFRCLYSESGDLGFNSIQNSEVPQEKIVVQTSFALYVKLF